MEAVFRSRLFYGPLCGPQFTHQMYSDSNSLTDSLTLIEALEPRSQLGIDENSSRILASFLSYTNYMPKNNKNQDTLESSFNPEEEIGRAHV